MRIFCPAIGSSSFSISTACLSRDVLRIESVPPRASHPAPAPTPAVGRVVLLTHNTRPGSRWCWMAPDGSSSRSGLQVRCGTCRLLTCQETRFRSQDVCRTPATQPKQPDYLGRDLSTVKIERPGASELARTDPIQAPD